MPTQSRRTLPCLAAVHSEVGGLVGFEARLLHARAIHLHTLGVTALSHIYLWEGVSAQHGEPPLRPIPFPSTTRRSLSGTVSLCKGAWRWGVETRAQGQPTSLAWGSTRPLGPQEVGRVRAKRTHPERALGHVDASPGDNDGVLNGLGGHVGAAEGAIAIRDDLDVNGAAIGVLWESQSKVFRGLRLPRSTGTLCGPQAVLLTHRHTRGPSQPRPQVTGD